ncbi:MULTISPECIES: branched-chain-amino-acid transaminase [Halobacillus]|uniref:Branched-chain-amino-acid aminotransferase n=1 Tax=Halobacillus halophilus (strain ATCC 35676 / DSM 2266 / JCM 20832 / KCTC 3685 / LMG 17431 / NBRC 102448 / NCIMB 2269) TaxID=866895 RepID=I0JL95_HALH3|nr:branched-chain-amino-acid transaminase [Halobacillus halophilus]ASF39038.1 branched-chain amino acid aminotransferase [Halobacillus halophilus]CCG44915.1 branched-chain amino acid aminotransferase [Halobacillus halophilus DSM 2266]
MSSQWIYLSGEFVNKNEAVVSVYDHGFLYGDGVFEGIRVYEGNIFKLDEHLNRLYDSAKSIMLQMPYEKEEMKEIIAETVRKNELETAYIRVVVSRGMGNLGLDPSSCSNPRVVVIAEALALFPKELYERGVRLASVSSRRNRPDVLPPQVKSLNYLNNILVKMEANQAGVDEALMMNDQGYVTEGSADNIFIVKNSTIYTPPTYLGALEGITRNAIIDLAKEKGYEMKEQPFTRHDVYVADEVFLTGTAAEVIAVVEVDQRPVGDGKPGVITNHLLSEFRKITTTDGYKVYNKDKVQVS